jgi:hypothetical protein
MRITHFSFLFQHTAPVLLQSPPERMHLTPREGPHERHNTSFSSHRRPEDPSLSASRFGDPARTGLPAACDEGGRAVPGIQCGLAASKESVTILTGPERDKSTQVEHWFDTVLGTLAARSRCRDDKWAPTRALKRTNGKWGDLTRVTRPRGSGRCASPGRVSRPPRGASPWA